MNRPGQGHGTPPPAARDATAELAQATEAAEAGGRWPTIEIDPVARSVRQHGHIITLTARAHDLLAALAGRPERVFGAAELIAAVWPGRRMEGNNLRMQVQVLRRALGPQAVVNVPGRGYKLGLTAKVCQAVRRASNLPHWAGTLLGRESDLSALQALLGQHRLVTVVGPGGIGKTRLAQQQALQQAGRHRDGAWWVDLATVAAGPAAAEAVARTVAQSLNLQTASMQGAAAAAFLGHALAEWQVLLLLDNAEHLAGTAGQLAGLVRSLLEAAPGLHLLVTSQQALKLPEEWIYRLAALTVPAPDATLVDARASPALQLLERRARAAHQQYVLPDDDVAIAADVVRRLDGVALAIEMAAARLPVLGVRALHLHLRQRLALFGGDEDVAPVRHATLRATLDWSHQLLSPAEQAALRRLSVFAAPFRPDMAAQVVATDGLDEAAALHAILGLADKSLLQLEPGSVTGAPFRLRILESTRLYAEEALHRRAGTERDGAHRRHVQAMANLAQLAKDDFYQASDAAWCAHWVPDHEDLMLGFDRARAHGNADAAAQIIELLVLGANITGRVEPAMMRAAASRELARDAAPLARARLLGWGGNLPSPGQSRVAAAAARVQAWREVPVELGREGLCTALAMLALAREEAADHAGADVALAECRQVEAPHWSARLRRRCSWIALSRMALERDDPAVREQADALSRRLVGELADLGAWRERSLVQVHLARVMRLQGQPAGAVELLLELSRGQTALGCHIDAGISLGIACAACVELAQAASPGDERPERWAQAGRAGLEALARLAPLPALMRHLLEPLALLACRLGDPAQGALLLAGAQRLRADHQHADDPMNARTLRQAHAELDARLSRAERALAEAHGRSLDGAALRVQAMAWLQPRVAPDARGDGNTRALSKY